MTQHQQTLQKPVSVAGVALHSGRIVHMTLKPAPENTGIVFRRTDMDPPVDLPAQPTLVNDTRLATTLNVGKVAVSTIEHLMSALAGLGVDNAIVEVDNLELPLLDGSARDFVALIEEAGLAEQEALRRIVRILRPVQVTEGDKWAKLEPADGTIYEFSIAFGHPVVDATPQTTTVTLADYREHVAFARTFGFFKDIEMLRGMGLVQGGSMENAVVVDDTRILNPEGLRAPDEFVKHKVLDAIGDLYVLGSRIEGHYSAFKSGHGLNNRLLRELLAQPDAWEIVTR